jgi:hypothetical protein
MAMALMVVAVPAASGAEPTPCRVRNITQGTHGRSFNAMVEAARGGDRLRVRGTCPAHTVIDVDLVIVGVGVGEVRPILTGRDRHGVLRIERDADVILRNLVVTNGHENPRNFGGGISNGGTLLILDSIIRGNEDLGRGGISNGGHLVLRNSAVVGNSAASGDGGGISNSGSMTILDSRIEGNTAYWDGYDVYPSGGGILNAGDLTIRRSIIRHNSAGVHGGGIQNSGRLLIAGSRIVANGAVTGAGVSNNWGGTVILRRTRVVANVARGDGGGIWNGFWSPWDDEQPEGVTSAVTLIASEVRRNRSATGGGIWNDAVPGGGETSVTLDAGSSVAGNDPDDCFGTTAC